MPETINTIRALLDEIPVLVEISKDLPPCYSHPAKTKIADFRAFLEAIHTTELNKKNNQKTLTMDTPEFLIIPKADFEQLTKEIKLIATDILAIRKSKEAEFLTIKEACAKLKCSPNTLHSYINDGKITPLITKSGVYKKRLFRNAEIEHFLRVQQ